MKFTVKIDCNSSAFAGDPLHELQRIMGILAGKLQTGRRDGSLLDINGNTVGSFELTETEED